MLDSVTGLASGSFTKTYDSGESDAYAVGEAMSTAPVAVMNPAGKLWGLENNKCNSGTSCSWKITQTVSLAMIGLTYDAAKLLNDSYETSISGSKPIVGVASTTSGTTLSNV